MRRSRKTLRLLWAICAFLQFALPGSVALADALEDDAPGTVAIPHFESHTTDSCPHAHGLDAFCQFLNAPFDIASPITIPLAEGRSVVQALAVPGVPSVGVRAALPQSRAPPSFS
jgi:hypothetical protein